MQFNPATDIPDLSGKVIVITGGNAGLGAETVKQLVPHNPQTVYLCARTPSSATPLITSLTTQYPNTSIPLITLDLTSLASAKHAAQEILSQTPRIDLLFLNAGIAGLEPGLTQEGYERHLGVNHIAHALFTQMLMPKLLETAKLPNADVRVINLASAVHALFAVRGGLALDEAKTTMASHGSARLYGQSKLANILFSKKLAEEYSSVKSVSLHPGLVKTGLMGKQTGTSWFVQNLVMAPLEWLTGLTVEEGAKNQLWAAVGEVKSGAYYMPIGKLDQGSKYARSEELKDELWRWTNEELAAHGAPGWPSAE